MKVTAALSSLPPLMELHRRLRHGGRAVVRQPRDCGGHLTTGRVHVVHRGAVPDVRAGEEAQPRQRRTSSRRSRPPERIFEMLDTHTEVHEQPGAPPLEPFRRNNETRASTRAWWHPFFHSKLVITVDTIRIRYGYGSVGYGDTIRIAGDLFKDPVPYPSSYPV